MKTSFMFGVTIASILGVALVAGASGAIPYVLADEGDLELKTDLIDEDGKTVGEAKYEMEDDESELKIKLDDPSIAEIIFEIIINGLTLGLIATDSEGSGEAKLKWNPAPVEFAEGTEIILSSDSKVKGTFTADDSDSDDHKIDICHKGKDLNVSENAWSGHQRHGDTMGKCSEADGDDDEGVESAEKKVKKVKKVKKDKKK